MTERTTWVAAYVESLAASYTDVTHIGAYVEAGNGYTIVTHLGAYIEAEAASDFARVTNAAVYAEVLTDTDAAFVTSIAAYAEIEATGVSNATRVTSLATYAEILVDTDATFVTSVAVYAEVLGVNNRVRTTEVAVYVEVLATLDLGVRTTALAGYVEVLEDPAIKVSKMVAYLETIGKGITVSQHGLYVETMGSGILVTKLLSLVELEYTEVPSTVALHAEKQPGGRYRHALLPDEVTGYALDPSWSFWSVIVPEATVNEIGNPSFENDLTDWAVTHTGPAPAIVEYPVVGAIAGRKVLRIPYDGTEYSVRTENLNTVPAGPVTASLWVYALGGTSIVIQIRQINTVLGSMSYTLPYTDWYRFSLTMSMAAANFYRMAMVVPAGQQRTAIYTDAWQFETKLYPTTYCDGDQRGLVEDLAHTPYHWNGIPHASTSRREVTTRSGGREYNLSSELDFLTTGIVGLGMAPLEIDKQSLMDGSEAYRGVIVRSRQFTITGRIYADNGLGELAEKRARLISYIKPDLTRDRQPMILRYTPRDQKGNDWARPIDIMCSYQEGMGGNITNWYMENLPLQFYATKPFVKDIAWQSAQLTVHTEFNPGSGFQMYRPAEVEGTTGIAIEEGWHDLCPDGDMTVGEWVVGAAIDPRNRYYYVVGSFTTINGQTVRGVGYTFYPVISTVNWFEPETGSFDAYPLGIGIGKGPRESEVAVMGTFTLFNAVPMVGFAVLTPGGSWAQLGLGMEVYTTSGGVTDIPNKIVGMPNGDYYAFGGIGYNVPHTILFNNMARWNEETSAWQACGPDLGTGHGLNDFTADGCIGPDGKIYVTGAFTGVAPTKIVGSDNHVVRYNQFIDEFESLGGGIPGTWDPDAHGQRIWVGKDNLIYVLFCEDATRTLYSIWRWNGSQWTQVIDLPVIERINAVDVDREGVFHLVGNFGEFATFPTQPRHINPWYMRVDGNTIYHGGLATANGWSTLSWPNWITIHDDYIFLNTTTMDAGATVINTEAITIVNNVGNADAKPIIHFRGQAEMFGISNLTTKTAIWFSTDLKLSSGEEVILDLTGDRVEFYSRVGADYTPYILGGASQLNSFRLAPGANRISVFMRDTDNQTEAWLEWRNTYWSGDWT